MTVLAALLALAAAIGMFRLTWRWWRRPADRGAAWRFALLLAGQPVVAGLLYLTLTTVAAPRGGTLVVATHGARGPLLGQRVVALPEAAPLAGAERVPDLATALRRYAPARLHVVGDGLRPRDRDAARGVPLDAAGEPPRGLVGLDRPPPVAAGAAFAVGGVVAGVERAGVDLIDPAGRRVASVTPDARGSFVVTGTARVPGPAEFTLRVRAGDRIVEDAPVAVWVDPAATTRLLLLAAAPGPEVKYLRRWASDAGVRLHVEIATGGGLALGDAPLPLTAATLARFDVAVIDARRWVGLGPTARAAVAGAARAGLGVLVRIDAPLTAPVRTALRGLGLAVTGGEALVPVRLAEATDDAVRLARAGPGTVDAPTTLNRGGDAPVLSRWAVQARGAPLMRDARGAAVGVWQAAGQGRVGLWPLADAYRLVLAGRGDEFGELWSGALTTLARANGRARPRIGPGWVGERVALCDLPAAARVDAPDGRATVPRRDPAADGCAAFWPRVAGWHSVVTGDGQRLTVFPVAARDALPNVAAAADFAATRALAAASPPARIDPAAQGAWPWFVAWLATSGGLWWFERSRLGRRPR